MGEVRRVLLADGERRRPPQLTGLLVADVEDLAWLVAHRIVRPGRELILPAVHGPGVAGPGLRDLEADGAIRHHVDPWRRCPLALAEDDHVVLAIRREAPETVEELELGPLGRRRVVGICGRAGANR